MRDEEELHHSYTLTHKPRKMGGCYALPIPKSVLKKEPLFILPHFWLLIRKGQWNENFLQGDLLHCFLFFVQLERKITKQHNIGFFHLTYKMLLFFFPLLQKLSYCPTSLPWISLFHCVGNSSSTSLIHWDKYHVAYLLSHKVYQLSFHEVRKSLDRCNQVAFQKKKKKKISFLQTFSGAYWHQFKLSYKWDRGIYPTKSNHISPLSGLEYRYRKVDATWTS